MNQKILVYGWYFRENVGDEFFIDAFKHLFPEFDFVFTDNITVELLQDVSAVFFGGGSFLYAAPYISDDALCVLQNMKIFYIGVGTETNIHPIHHILMSKAKLIATRSSEQIDKIKTINSNSIVIPDIVYSLQDKIKVGLKKSSSVLVLPNFDVVSQNTDPVWKNSAWEYFKSEFSQFLDVLYEQKFHVSFFAMCANVKMNDDWAAIEIINKMNHRGSAKIVSIKDKNIDSVTELFSKFDVIITQRYHGIILSEMTRTPYMTIYHHDKIKNSYPREGKAISYYGLSKQKILEEFYSTIKMNFVNVLPIESNMFTELKLKVLEAINSG